MKERSNTLNFLNSLASNECEDYQSNHTWNFNTKSTCFLEADEDHIIVIIFENMKSAFIQCFNNRKDKKQAARWCTAMNSCVIQLFCIQFTQSDSFFHCSRCKRALYKRWDSHSSNSKKTNQSIADDDDFLHASTSYDSSKNQASYDEWISQFESWLVSERVHKFNSFVRHQSFVITHIHSAEYWHHDWNIELFFLHASSSYNLSKELSSWSLMNEKM